MKNQEKNGVESEFGVPHPSTNLGRVMAAIKASISYNGSDEDLDKSPEFEAEMRRWNAHQRKYSSSKGYKKFRPIEIQNKDKPIYMKYENGTIAVSTRICKASKKTRHKVDYVQFTATKCGKCWRAGTSCYHNCQYHASDIAKNIGVLKDDTKKEESVVAICETEFKKAGDCVDWTREAKSKHSPQPGRFKKYIEEEPLSRFTSINSWKIPSGPNVEDRRQSCKHTLNVSCHNMLFVSKLCTVTDFNLIFIQVSV